MWGPEWWRRLKAVSALKNSGAGGERLEKQRRVWSLAPVKRRASINSGQVKIPTSTGWPPNKEECRW
jgi:hypothetical protein